MKSNLLLSRIGEVYISKEGCLMKIIDCIDASNYTVEFKNGVKVYNKSYFHIKNGSVKNPYHPSVHSVGYLGVEKHTVTKNGEVTKTYKTWSSMLERCYNLKCRNKQGAYLNCKVDPIWHCFQNFGDWFDKNYKNGYELDKDILVKGNKIYSPETCCFVPKIINYSFISCKNTRGKYPVGVRKSGNKFTAILRKNDCRVHLGNFDTPEEAFLVYKLEKESWIKELAEEWKLLIDKHVYQAMITYPIEITD